MQLEKPKTHGEVLLDKANEKRIYPEFNTHTPPDITPHTRVLAVLGIRPREAAPNDDGWLLSDFFAFYHMFRGLTKNQTWMHALDLEDLVAAHGQYLHGDPFKTRKIVLDKGILDRATQARDLHPVKIGSLQVGFREQLKIQSEAAVKEGQGLLVLIFGHGNGKNGGFLLPSLESTVKEDEISKIVAGLDIPITIISTACYSGGWSCNNNFDMSVAAKRIHHKEPGTEFNKDTLMAAGSEFKGKPWNYTTTIGRACGPMFSTAMIEALTRLENKRPLMELDEDDDTGHSEEQQSTYEDFSKTVYETLLQDVDRRGYQHDISFSAQDDAWEMCWRERTGIPLGAYEARWNSLEDHDPDPQFHPGDPWNRDPHVTAAQEAEHSKLKAKDKGVHFYRDESASGSKSETSTVLGKRKTSGIFGGSIQERISQVSSLGGQYLESYKGFDDTADDGSLHNHIYRIQQGLQTNVAILEKCLRTLQYRMDQMSTADEYLRAMSVSPPCGQRCHEFQTYRLSEKIDSRAGEGRYRSILNLIFERSVLFPDPLREQGHQFWKGPHYLVAAFYNANLSEKEVVEKLDTLAATVLQEIEYRKDMIKNDPEIKSRRQELFRAFGIESGRISH